MVIRAIKTRRLLPPKDDLYQVILESIDKLEENCIVCITSKVVSIGEGRCIPIGEIDKEELILKVADQYLPRGIVPHALWTITNNILIRSAGIDESNSKDHYVIWPKDPYKSARELWQFLRKKYQVKNLGVIITDSISTPLRRGIVGISLAHFGFVPIRDYRGTKDLFGRELKVSQSNIADSLATTAVLNMGEGDEGTPIVIVNDLPFVEFSDKPFRPKKEASTFEVTLDEDIFSPFLTAVDWKKGGKSS